MPASETKRVRLHLKGQVQGVGFRPYVYRLARAAGLTGHVSNDPAGATVEVQGPPQRLEDFARRLPAQLPPLAEVADCRQLDIAPVEGEQEFEIRPSSGGELSDAQVTVDTATCDDCLAELADPADPRYQYPFINCTNCGPRYSIIKRIPYDRPNTTMADFSLCRYCAGQYTDPADRRFHAQPIACSACGPSCWLVDAHGKQILCDDAIAAAAEAIGDGRIVAIKGLGGFHLACRADDEGVVRRLRRRKARDAKPFALMLADLDQARRICRVDAAAERLLAGPLRPIVLLPRLPAAQIAEAIAFGLDTLAVMLPYTPLHHLLMGCDLGPLVMTSGNVADEPLTKDNEDAVAHLGRIADAILLHNRRIQRSLDDSVAQSRPTGPVVVRRARGYAPRPVDLPPPPTAGGEDLSILAVGAELKNAVCLYRAGRAVVSEHIGDLKDGRTYRRFIQAINDLEELFDLRPGLIAADAHPAYLSTEYALRRSRGELAGRAALPIVRVQHHHAHVVSCMAENHHTDECIGIAADGVGYGPDGAVWGCEIMRASPSEFTRLGHLRYFALPGGDAAAEQTARPAVSLLTDAFGADAARAAAVAGRFCKPDLLEKLTDQLAAGVNCPQTSSLGRLFDAVAAMCGLAEVNRYEAEAPMLLEAAAAGGIDEQYPFELTGESPFQIDHRPMIRAISADLEAGASAGVVSAKFHNTVAGFLAGAAARARELTGLGTVALSGGCFANRYLSGRLESQLTEAGFEVLTHRHVPCNDGGVALGQAIVAAYKTCRPRAERKTHVPGSAGKD